MSIRQDIVDAVETAVTGLATTGANVHNRRTFALGTVPALNVYWSQDEPSYDEGTLGSIPMRRLEVHVEGYIKGDDESVLDDIYDEVEPALYADQTLGGLAIGIELGTHTIGPEGEGEDRVLAVDLVYVVFYRTAEGAPGVAV